MTRLTSTVAKIAPVDARWIEQARARQLQLTKPPGSLGRLEEIANRLAAIQGTLSPSADPAKVLLFAADHGVCAEGVNPYPQAVTAQMVMNFLRGGAAINALARTVGADLEIIDVGVATELPSIDGLIRKPVARGTRNFCEEPAMSEKDALAALSVGMDAAADAIQQGYRLLAIGEMGIGNTTAASAVTAALTRLAPESVVGRGTGADEGCMQRKRSAIERALDRHLREIHTPLDLLARLGGLEIAAMCGVCLEASSRRCAVLIDGFISTAAAAVAVRFNPLVRDYLIAAHRSTEPGHAPLLEQISQRPLLDLEMRLGEGTGAALAIPILRAAVEAFTSMATFESAGVAEAL